MEMKKITAGIGCLLLLLVLCSHVFAEKVVLSAGEVTEFFSDKTMTVKEESVDPKTGQSAEFKAFFSKLGGVRALEAGGAAETYNWSVSKDGAFCARNSRRWRDGICGFVVKENDSYALYVNKRGNQKAKAVDGRAIFDNRWKHFLSFSEILAGEQL